MSWEQAAYGSQEGVVEDDPALLVDQAPCGYMSTTMDGRIVKANVTMCTWLGVEAESLLGRHLVELLTAGGRIYYETHYAPMLRMQGFVREIAIDFLRVSGESFPGLLNATLVRSPDGDPHLVRVAVFDATERRSYERELVRTRDEQEAELKVRTEQAASATATVSQIIDAATGTLLVATDPDFIVTHFNRGAQQLLGYTAEEALGKPSAWFHDPDEAVRHSEALGVAPELSTLVPALVAYGEPTDWTLPTRSGERKIMSLSFTEIRDGHRLVGYLCAGEDVSNRLRTEAAQVEALRRELESVARLEEADRMKEEVISTISHELRTPIASITGYSELLAEGDLGELAPEQTDAVTKVLRNAARLSSLVDDLLHLDRAGSLDVPLRREPSDMVALLVQAFDDLKEAARGRDLTVDLHVPGHPVRVLGDPVALERVVLNLGGNAIKFTPDGGSVDLTLASSPVGCVLKVADTGIGISEEDQPRVRGRFFRSSEAYRRAVPGTGLGLSVVDAIVAAHGGTIDITSAPGRGTTVTVVLPVYADDPSVE